MQDTQDLIIPEIYDKEVVLSWIGRDENIKIIEAVEDEGQFLVATKEFHMNGNPPTVRFLRFFIGGNKTRISVDYDSTVVPLETKLINMLIDKYSY